MTIAPVSGDMLVKLAVGALLVGAGVWAVRKAASAGSTVAGTALAAATAAADSVNPVNPNNVFAQAANRVVSGATGRDETLGGWFYSATHSDPMGDVNPTFSIGTPPAPLDTTLTFGSSGGFFGQPGATF